VLAERRALEQEIDNERDAEVPQDEPGGRARLLPEVEELI
jgi:hypothetical protein